MSIDADASPRIAAWGARFWASPTVQALIGAQSAIYYPEVPALKGDDRPAFPFVVLYREKLSLERSAPGENDDTAGNSMSAVIYFDPDTHSIAQVEAKAEAICAELVESEEPDTLDVIRAECTRASKPAKSQDAAADDDDGGTYRTLAIVAWYS